MCKPNGVGKQQQAGNYDLFDLHCLAKVAKRPCNGVAVSGTQALLELWWADWAYSRRCPPSGKIKMFCNFLVDSKSCFKDIS